MYIYAYVYILIHINTHIYKSRYYQMKIFLNLNAKIRQNLYVFVYTIGFWKGFKN